MTHPKNAQERSMEKFGIRSEKSEFVEQWTVGGLMFDGTDKMLSRTNRIKYSDLLNSVYTFELFLTVILVLLKIWEK